MPDRDPDQKRMQTAGNHARRRMPGLIQGKEKQAMSRLIITIGRSAAGVAFLVAAALIAGPASGAADDDTGAGVKPVFAQPLPNVPGKTLTAVVVSYAPGGKSVNITTPAASFAYVLSGAIRSENSATGPVQGLQGRRELLRAARQRASGQRECQRHRAREPVGGLCRRRRRTATHHLRQVTLDGAAADGWSANWWQGGVRRHRDLPRRRKVRAP